MADDDPYVLAKLLFPLRRKSSGALVYRLTEESVSAMEADPLVYLKNAVRAREGLSRRRAPFAYRDWRRVALPPALTATWLPKGAGRLSRSMEAYFTSKTDGKALLVVIPSQRIAFYVWCD